MHAWFVELVGPQLATPVQWIVAGLVLAILLLIFARLLRSLRSGTFVAGGRNRRARLAVMDAAAVDSRRRLVLVRRDDVEHLILIGGPTDVVVEQDIRLATRTQRTVPPETLASPPHAASEAPPEPAKPRLVSGPPPAPAPSKQPEPARSAAPAVSAPDAAPRAAPAVREHGFVSRLGSAAAAPPPAPVSSPVRPLREPTLPGIRPGAERAAAPAHSHGAAPATPLRRAGDPPVAPAPAAAPPVAAPVPHPAAARKSDEQLLRELENTLDGTRRKQQASGPDDRALEDEMTKLLGDLSAERQ